MYQATINNSFSISFSEEILLSELLARSGSPISAPCGGDGTCGKCKVIAKGCLSPLNEKEKALLTAEEQKQGFRLACIAKATGDVFITVQEAQPVVEIGFSFEPELFRYDVTDGLVIDIGTTTVAAVLYQDKTPIKIVTEANRQACYGADVITRIVAERNHPGALSYLLKSQTEGIIAACNSPKNIVIIANTVMLHFLTQQNVLPLGEAPYQTADLFGKTYSLFQRECYLAPCVSAFVGGDITAGVLASRMCESTEKSMLVDLGTNGEIAYFDGSCLSTASTAAGPAFEGAGIFMGMPAKMGAIDHIYYKNGAIIHTTIGNTKPEGICSSGLVDALAVMRECGVLAESGALSEEHPLCSRDLHGRPCFRISGTDVILTQEDIRTLQLAKGAIHAGMLTLAEQVDTLYVSGGFGSRLNPENAEKIGLLPKHYAKKIKILGNTALHGGTLALFSKQEREKLSQIANRSKTIILSENPDFTEAYIKAMTF